MYFHADSSSWANMKTLGGLLRPQISPLSNLLYDIAALLPAGQYLRPNTHFQWTGLHLSYQVSRNVTGGIGSSKRTLQFFIYLTALYVAHKLDLYSVISFRFSFLLPCQLNESYWQGLLWKNVWIGKSVRRLCKHHIRCKFVSPRTMNDNVFFLCLPARTVFCLPDDKLWFEIQRRVQLDSHIMHLRKKLDRDVIDEGGSYQNNCC